MTCVRIPAESRALLAAASVLVPRSFRREWRREWNGEVWWWLKSQTQCGRSTGERIALALHCFGAFRDGFCLCRDDESGINRLRAALGQPALCLATGLFIIACTGVLSRGFENTRRSWEAAFAPQHHGIVLLSQTGPFMGLQLGVPPLKVAIWDHESQTLEGAATYSWSTMPVAIGTPLRSEVSIANVGARFFSLLGAEAFPGRVFRPDDVESCGACTEAVITIAATSEDQRGESKSFLKLTTDDRECLSEVNGNELSFEISLGRNKADHHDYGGSGNADDGGAFPLRGWQNANRRDVQGGAAR